MALRIIVLMVFALYLPAAAAEHKVNLKPISEPVFPDSGFQIEITASEAAVYAVAILLLKRDGAPLDFVLGFKAPEGVFWSQLGAQNLLFSDPAGEWRGTMVTMGVGGEGVTRFYFTGPYKNFERLRSEGYSSFLIIVITRRKSQENETSWELRHFPISGVQKPQPPKEGV